VVTATLTVGATDASCATDYDVTVTVGREAVDEQPSASVLTVASSESVTARIGDPVVLSDAYGRMFGGTVTDLDAEWDAFGAVWRTRLIAAGPLADLGREWVGDTPWPQESDSARVDRVLTLVAAPHNVDPAILGPEMLGTDVDHRTALDYAQSVAQDALGVLWEQPADAATPIRYAPQRVRAWDAVAIVWSEVQQGMTWATMPADLTWDAVAMAAPNDAVPALDLDCTEVLADVVLSSRVGDHVGQVTVLWGPPADPGAERAAETVGDGTPAVRLDTQLATAGGALQVADTVWRARREPLWRLTRLTVPTDTLPPARVQQIRGALTVGTRLTVTLPAGAPAGSRWEGYLEGWRHELADGRHDLILATSERGMTEPADRWQDVPPQTAWATLPADLLWDDALDMGGP
jgi:hypothetical protein